MASSSRCVCRTSADERAARSLFVWARLEDGVALEQARAELEAIGRVLESEHPDDEPRMDGQYEAAAGGVRRAAGPTGLRADVRDGGGRAARRLREHREPADCPRRGTPGRNHHSHGDWREPVAPDTSAHRRVCGDCRVGRRCQSGCLGGPCSACSLAVLRWTRPGSRQPGLNPRMLGRDHRHDAGGDSRGRAPASSRRAARQPAFWPPCRWPHSGWVQSSRRSRPGRHSSGNGRRSCC